jgi:PEP-CTERM motif
MRLARILTFKSRVALCCAALLIFSTARLHADNIAFMGTVSGQFGTIDLKTGVFTVLGNSGQTLAGMAVADATLYATSYHTSVGTLYTVNPANGSLTAVGTSSIDIDDFGSTTSGLYAVGVDGDLYSINSAAGAATLIGPTGLAFGTWRSLSTNSSILYFANGAYLYTLNTTTGAATLIGNMGGPEEGAMLLEGGILYGGENLPVLAVDTLSIATGAATVGPSLTGTSSPFFALAPNPLPAKTPEPTTLALLGAGITALVVRKRLACPK